MARLIVEQSGPGVAVQDFGRRKFRALGVPLSGALDISGLAAANLLARAPENSAGLELLLAGLSFRVENGPLRLGLAGDVTGVLTRADGLQEKIGGWRGLVLHEGDFLSLRLPRGPGYLGFSGGLDLKEVLGSRSTFVRAGFGGMNGRALQKGDALDCAESDGDGLSAPPFILRRGKIRFIPGPQAQHFPPEALELFAASDWRVGGESDRMGMRLSGPRLQHGAAGANIVSDGATPGAIQIPGDGQPIVLRADCQTSGGYAKIGCVICADIGRLAHFAPGEAMRFMPVDHAQAAQARKDLREEFARWRSNIALAGEEWDSGRLWSENLISGAILGD